jgi:hypothetical protein
MFQAMLYSSKYSGDSTLSAPLCALTLNNICSHRRTLQPVSRGRTCSRACNAMQCNAMQCNAMQCNAMQCNVMQ